MDRLSDGEPLRRVMRAQGINIPRLVDLTRDIDPDERGVSLAVIGALTSNGPSARAGCHPRTAYLISKALRQPIERLFEIPDIEVFGMPSRTTKGAVHSAVSSTRPTITEIVEKRPWVDVHEIAENHGFDVQTIYQWVKTDPDFPYLRIGRGKRKILRFDPAAVDAYLRTQAERNAA